MLEILTELAKLSPIIALLIVGLIYFYRKESAYKKELKEERETCDVRLDELNKELRDNEKQNLEMIGKLANALEKLSDSTQDISKELVDLKHCVELKLEELKNTKN